MSETKGPPVANENVVEERVNKVENEPWDNVDSHNALHGAEKVTYFDSSCELSIYSREKKQI